MSGLDDDDRDRQAQTDRDLQWKERQADFARWRGKSIRVDVPTPDTMKAGNNNSAGAGVNEAPARPVQEQRSWIRGSKGESIPWKIFTFVLRALLFQSLVLVAIMLWHAQSWICPFPDIHGAGGSGKGKGAAGDHHTGSTVNYIAILPQLDSDGLRCRMAALGDQLQDSRLDDLPSQPGYYLPRLEHVQSVVGHLAELHTLEVAAGQNLSGTRQHRDELGVQRVYARGMAHGVHPLVTFSHPHHEMLGTLVAPGHGLLALSFPLSPSTWIMYRLRLWSVLHLEPLLRYACIASCRDAGQQHYEAIQKDTQITAAHAVSIANDLATEAARVLAALDKGMELVCNPAEVVFGGKPSAHYLQDMGKGLVNGRLEAEDIDDDGGGRLPISLDRQHGPRVLEEASKTVYNDAAAATRNLCVELRRRILKGCEDLFGTAMGVGNQPKAPKHLPEQSTLSESWRWCALNLDGGAVKLLRGIGHDLFNEGAF